MINLVDEFILFDCVQFTRRDWRNRNKLKTPRGVEWLTIPVESKGNYHARIDEIKTSNSSWAQEHWQKIRHNYAKAPCFSEYKDLVENLYGSLDSDSLSVINRKFLERLCEVLDIRTKLTSADDYQIEGDKNMRLINLCLQAGADTYVSGPAAKSYVDEKLFEANGIKLIWMDYGGYAEYRQLFPPFEHGVSILDLIFNEGKDASRFMNSFASQNRCIQ